MEGLLRLCLPAEVASASFGCIEAARRHLATPDDSSLTPGEDNPLRPSARIARAFVQRHHRVPDWVGLFEEWVLTYDVPADPPDRRTRRLFERGGLARVRGRAPLDGIWQLGAEALGV